MTLARRFVDRLVLTEGEQAADAVAGCVAVAMRRASGFGRAPMIGDLEMAFGVWGFLATAPDDLVALRKPLFGGASHHYAHQRHIADMVAPATLRLTPSEVRARVTTTQWRDLFSSP